MNNQYVFRGLLSLAAVASVCVMTGCNIDDQKVVSEADKAYANPVPTARDFSGNNAKHKILVAAVDSGVDYNNPKLLANAHFKLSAAGVPVGYGKDLVGNDDWSSPYVVRTTVYDPKVDEEKRKAAAGNASAMAKIIQKFPALAGFLEPRRAAAMEFLGGSYHGTHVAGLMVYDRPDFGLTAYRVLPQNDYQDDAFDYTTEAIDSIAAAIDAAAADGARVVNMSIGLDFQRAIKSDDGAASEEEYKKLLALSERLTATVKKYPNVLFVAAAGNANSWKDGLNRLGMPCGVKAANVLCVGALRENGEPTTFTDVVVSGVDLVFALGQNVLSTVPTQMCLDSNLQMLATLNGETEDATLASFGAALNDACNKNPGMGKLSGTSMASPIVAHVGAEILVQNPALSGAEAVREILNRAAPSFIGTLPVYKLKIQKPSWYADGKKNGRNRRVPLTGGGMGETDDSWTAFVPKQVK